MHYHSKTGKITLLSLFVSLALILNYIERSLGFVFFIPGLKLGFANVVVLFTMIAFSIKDAFIVTFVRVLLSALFITSGVSFLYSLFGSLLSFLFMAIFYKYFKNLFSIIGISIIGSFSHNTAQMVVLGILLKDFKVSLSYYPYLIIISLITGLITGYLAYIFIKHWEKIQ